MFRRALTCMNSRRGVFDLASNRSPGLHPVHPYDEAMMYVSKARGKYNNHGACDRLRKKQRIYALESYKRATGK